MALPRAGGRVAIPGSEWLRPLRSLQSDAVGSSLDHRGSGSWRLAGVQVPKVGAEGPLVRDVDSLPQCDDRRGVPVHMHVHVRIMTGQMYLACIAKATYRACVGPT